MIESELLSIKIFLVKVTLKISQEKYLLLILFWKLILGLLNYKWVIRDKVKVVLDLWNYGTKKEFDHATGVDTFDLAAKKDFIALKAEVEKLDINKSDNVPVSLNNVKPKVDNLDFGKFSDAVNNEVFKDKKFNTLKMKVNNLEKKFLMQLI